MKSSPSKKPAKKPAAASVLRKPTKASAPVSGKRPAKRAANSKSSVQVTPRKAPSPAPSSQRDLSGPELSSKDLTREILEEIRALRSVVAASAPASVRAADEAADLESAVDSMRRLLSEYQERRTDQWLQELAAIRETIADPLRADPAEGLRRIDVLFDRLGAIQFSARNLDFVDPAIHEVTAERNRSDIPDGVVMETLRPGLRGGGGGLICKARVAVNRRGSHEPVGH